MYEVRVRAGFCAVHRLRLPDGAWEPVHGHDWKVEAVFRGAKLDLSGMLVDFIAAEQALKRVVEPLHHADLNEAALLAGLNPSTEHVARRVFEALRQTMGPGVPLSAVYVEEAPGCIAGYLGAAENAPDKPFS